MHNRSTVPSPRPESSIQVFLMPGAARAFGFAPRGEAFDQLGGKSNVTTRLELLKPRLDLGRQVQLRDKPAHRLAVDRASASQLFQPLVRIFQTVAAHHGL